MSELLSKAEQAYTSKKYQEALKLYKSVLTLEPRNALALAGAADCLYNLTNWHNRSKIEDAIEMSERALAVDSKLLKPHVILSYLYGYKGDRDRSEREATAALELNPNSADALCSYGIVLLIEGKLQEAIQYLQKAIDIDPNMYLAHYNLSVCYQANSDYKSIYRQDRILFRLKPNIKNLIRVIAAYFVINRPVLAIFFGAPLLGIVVDPRFKIFLIFHVFMILLYISSGLLSLRSKDWSVVKRNFLMAIILIALDLFFLLSY